MRKMSRNRRKRLGVSVRRCVIRLRICRKRRNLQNGTITKTFLAFFNLIRIFLSKREYGYFDRRITFRWGLLPPTTKYHRDVLFGFEDLVGNFETQPFF